MRSSPTTKAKWNWPMNPGATGRLTTTDTMAATTKGEGTDTLFRAAERSEKRCLSRASYTRRISARSSCANYVPSRRRLILRNGAVYPPWLPSARTPPSIRKSGTDSLRVPEEGCLSPISENRFPRVFEEGCLSPTSRTTESESAKPAFSESPRRAVCPRFPEETERISCPRRATGR